MENKILSYREIGGWLLVIFITGLLNAIGDAVMLLQTIVKTWGINMLFSHIFTWLIPFSGIFINKPLFFIAMPVTLLCNVLCLVFIGIRKLFLFKLFFFSACLIALLHLLCNAIILYHQTIFDGFVLADRDPFIAGIIEGAFDLVKKLYPAFLITGTAVMIGVLFVCFVYFKRSKRIAVYFGSSAKRVTDKRQTA
jgi:hypothetical protein